MRIMLTGGGTGGHVYPALSVAEVLPERAAGEPVEFLLASTTRGDIDRLAARAGIPFVPIAAAPLRGAGALALARAAWRIAAGVLQSWRILGEFRPRAVLATGGYASVPISLAARLRRIPLVVYLPDVYPGWSVRLLGRLATRIATTAEDTLSHLPRRKTVVTGYPVRRAFWRQDRAAARTKLGFDAGTPLLLVTGATQGARVLNEAVLAALPELLPRCAVLHQTGAAGIAAAHQAAERLPPEQRERYRPIAYLDDMPAAMAAADVAVMRSGASALAEPPATGLPAVLVPGRFAGAHQRHNAAFMASRGAALLLDEADLSGLAAVVTGLLADRQRMAQMAAAARALARPDAAQRIADLVLEVAT